MAVVFSDTFTAADNTTLQAHDASWAKNTADAPVDLVIKSGGVVLSSGAIASTYINTAAGVLSDQLVEADIVFATASLGIHSVIARSATASRAFYLARWNGGLLQLYRFEAGSVVKHGNDISAPVTTGQTHRLGLRCVGNQISLEWNGVTKIGPITDATYASGYPGIRVIEPETVRIDNFSVDNLAASDTTAPTLTSPTASATGATTASGSVSTNEANGTLYYLATANASETVAMVKAGSSQAVTATLEQPVTVTGLTASTSYYLHFVHRDAAGNDSAVATSAQFTTAAANTSPSFTGPSIDNISGTEGVALTPVDVSAKFFDSESGLTFSTVGSWPAGVTVSSAGVISGTPTTAGTYTSLQVRATDAGALTADSNAFSITVAAAAVPTITSDEFKNNTGTLLASATIPKVWLIPFGTPDYTNLVTNGAGELVISEAGLSGDYLILTANADGTEVGVSKATAS